MFYEVYKYTISRYYCTGISAVFKLLILTGNVRHIVSSYEKLSDLDTFTTGRFLHTDLRLSHWRLKLMLARGPLPSNNKQITPTLLKHFLIANKQTRLFFYSNLFVIIEFFSEYRENRVQNSWENLFFSARFFYSACLRLASGNITLLSLVLKLIYYYRDLLPPYPILKALKGISFANMYLYYNCCCAISYFLYS